MEAVHSTVLNSPALHSYLDHLPPGGQRGKGAEGHHGVGQEAGHAFSSTQENKSWVTMVNSKQISPTIDPIFQGPPKSRVARTTPYP